MRSWHTLGTQQKKAYSNLLVKYDEGMEINASTTGRSWKVQVEINFLNKLDIIRDKFWAERGIEGRGRETSLV